MIVWYKVTYLNLFHRLTHADMGRNACDWTLADEVSESCTIHALSGRSATSQLLSQLLSLSSKVKYSFNQSISSPDQKSRSAEFRAGVSELFCKFSDEDGRPFDTFETPVSSRKSSPVINRPRQLIIAFAGGSSNPPVCCDAAL